MMRRTSIIKRLLRWIFADEFKPIQQAWDNEIWLAANIRRDVERYYRHELERAHEYAKHWEIRYELIADALIKKELSKPQPIIILTQEGTDADGKKK